MSEHQVVVTLTAPSPPTLPRSIDGDAALLLAFVRTRDDQAFGRLVGRHAEAVRTIAYRNTGNAAAAEDVTQATFIVLTGRLRQAMRSARRTGSVRPWLAKVCRYCCSNWRRAEARRRKHERGAAVPERVDPSEPGELTEAVAAAMRALRFRERRVIELRHFEDKPWPEVAAAMRTTPDAAKKAGQRALERLRGVLEARGVTAGMFAVVASLTALRSIGRAAPAATPFTYELARGVLTMMKIKTISATVIALTTVGLIGFGVNEALSQSGDGDGASIAVGATGGSGSQAVLAQSDDTRADVQAGGDPGHIAGLPAEMFGRIHGAPPQVVLESAIDFEQVPLIDAISFLREATGLPIDFHAGSLELEGISADTPVTFHTPAGTELGQAMRRMLPLVGSGFAQPRFAWRHGAYVVTTADGLAAMDETVQSQLGELLLEKGEAQ